MPGKRKAAAQKAGSDSDCGTGQTPKHSSEAQPQPANPVRSASRRECKKSKKQADIDHSELLKRLKKLENENKTLQRAQTRGKQQRAATSTTKQPDNAAGNNEDGENSNGLNCDGGNDNWPPEDKDNNIIGYESQVQMRHHHR
ncbi:hypothetical protein BC835DRAFT_1305689 [Cytidiella melzeri]|nr:hypothetical protein BC835DRAFT_1305689 [Cytidiella melzeri]